MFEPLKFHSTSNLLHVHGKNNKNKRSDVYSRYMID